MQHLKCFLFFLTPSKGLPSFSFTVWSQRRPGNNWKIICAVGTYRFRVRVPGQRVHQPRQSRPPQIKMRTMLRSQKQEKIRISYPQEIKIMATIMFPPRINLKEDIIFSKYYNLLAIILEVHGSVKLKSCKVTTFKAWTLEEHSGGRNVASAIAKNYGKWHPLYSIEFEPLKVSNRYAPPEMGTVIVLLKCRILTDLYSRTLPETSEGINDAFAFPNRCGDGNHNHPRKNI